MFRFYSFPIQAKGAVNTMSNLGKDIAEHCSCIVHCPWHAVSVRRPLHLLATAAALMGLQLEEGSHRVDSELALSGQCSGHRLWKLAQGGSATDSG